MQSKAATVEQYLAELAPDRRQAIQAVREVILKNLDKNFEEGMQYGMIGYYVPHRVFPAGYHCDPSQPLPYACLASQKNHMSLYLMSIYGEGANENWFRSQWAKSGKKLDMGKCCIRFKRLDDLALDVIGELIRRVSAKTHIEQYGKWLLENAASKANPKNTPAGRKPDSDSPKKALRSNSQKATKSSRKQR